MSWPHLEAPHIHAAQQVVLAAGQHQVAAAAGSTQGAVRRRQIGSMIASRNAGIIAGCLAG
jgi:hypothetical protein